MDRPRQVRFELVGLGAAGLIGAALVVHACAVSGLSILHASRAFVPAAALIAACLLMDWLDPRRDHLLLVPIALVGSVSIALLWRLDGYYAAKQTLWMGVGALVLTATYLLIDDIRDLRSVWQLSGVAALVLLLATMLFGEERNGAKLWLGIPGMAVFQPGEVAKVLLAVFLAGAFASYREQRNKAKSKQLLGVGLLTTCALAVGILLLQRDFGAAALMLGLVLITTYVATGSSILVLTTMGLFAVGAVAAITLLPSVGQHASHVVERRLLAWVNPWADPFNTGYQALQGLLCFAHGGLFGAGAGLGLPGSLPVAESDMIYAVAAEDLGYAGSVALLLAYALISWRSYHLALAAKDDFSRLLATGIGALISLQSLVVVGGVLRVLPLTGVTLPWLSHGGTSVVMSFLAVGLLLCISRDSVDWTVSAGEAAMKSRLVAVAIATLAIFGLLTVVQAYWQVIAAPSLIGAPYDRHAALRREIVRPGAVWAADGEPILTPMRTDLGWIYRYERPKAFSHLAGYSADTGLQKSMREILLGEGKYTDWRSRLFSPQPRGCDVELTVDAGLQEEAVRALANTPGCIVVLRVSDGAVLTAASSPDCAQVAVGGDASILEIASTDPYEPLIFRPTQKLYRPGWAMALVTQAAALDSRESGTLELPGAAGQHGSAAPSDLMLRCDGSWHCGRKTYRCVNVHGSLTLSQAVAGLCKVGVQQAAATVGSEGYKNFVKKVHLLDAARIYMPSVPGRMPDLFNWRGHENLAETAIGEGAVRLTPLSVARFLLTVSRGGEVLQPYLLARVVGPSGGERLVGAPVSFGQGFSQAVADRVSDTLAEIGDGLRREDPSFSGLAAAAWWVPETEDSVRGEAWFVALSPWPRPTAVLTCVVERVEEPQAAAKVGLSLLNYLRGLTVW